MSSKKPHPPSAGSISIRFNAASMTEDSDDEDVLSGSPRDALMFEMHKASVEDLQATGTTTVLGSSESKDGAKSPNKEPVVDSDSGTTVGTPKEDKSLLSGLKEKLDPLTTFINEKLEDLSNGDNNKVDPCEAADEDQEHDVSMIRSNELATQSLEQEKNSSSRASLSLEKSFEVNEEYFDEDVEEVMTESTAVSSSLMGKSFSADQIAQARLRTSKSDSSSKVKSKVNKLIRHASSSADSSDRTSPVKLSCLMPDDDRPMDDPAYNAGAASAAVHTTTTSTCKPSTTSPPSSLPSTTTTPHLNRPRYTQVPVTPAEAIHVPWGKIYLSLAVLVIYLLVPLCAFTYGLFLGIIVCSCVFKAYLWVCAPRKPIEPFVVPDIKNLEPLRVPEIRDASRKDKCFKGWMNELKNYNCNDYHINQTTSIYVTLEGTMLRLQRPKSNISKRAMWDEGHISVTFIHQRHFNLSGSHVCLLPTELVKKRLWSKKYPICIALAYNDSPTKDTVNTGSLTKITSPKEKQSDDDVKQTLLYLFARTGREKEEWYRRFLAASKGTPLPPRTLDLLEASKSPTCKEAKCKMIRQGSLDSNLTLASMSGHTTTTTTTTTATTTTKTVTATITTSSDEVTSEPVIEEPASPYAWLECYLRYMAHVVPADCIQRLTPGTCIDHMALLSQDMCDPNFMFLNAFVGRLFWDFLRQNYWATKMTEKIQRKLSKIHVPYFIDDLTVTDIHFGGQVPLIKQVSKAYLDDRGLWIDASIVYNGGFIMSLETKVNLMKLKKSTCEVSLEAMTDLPQIRSPITDSDEEDSAESSSNDEEEPIPDTVEEGTSPNRGTSKKILRIVDKITQSRYFQQATENKYIKKAMKGVSDTPIQLTVQLNRCVGTVAINIPPPPTDRVWYGFRENPQLLLTAKPKVGERAVTVSHVTEWIEKKLKIEFQRVLVMPNMDDLVIPLMCDNLEDIANL